MKPDRRHNGKDVLSPEQRRRCMAHNKGQNTKPELALRRLCWAAGLRYRLHAKLPGRPDFVFVREKVAVFVDGCFWHGCPLHYVAPATRSEFWKNKLETNRARDLKVTTDLIASGWLVIRIWEHELKNETSLSRQADRILEAVKLRHQ